MEKKSPGSFKQQAARASWIAPLVGTFIAGVGTSAAQSNQSPIPALIVGWIFLLLLFSGFILGIIGCFGFKEHGAKTTILPGITGAVLNFVILGIVLSIAVPNYLNAREAHESTMMKSIDGLQRLADQANLGLPTMINENTQFAKVTVVSSEELEYHYSITDLSKSEIDVDDFVTNTETVFGNLYRNSEEFRIFRENNINVRFTYSDKNGELIMSVLVTQ